MTETTTPKKPKLGFYPTSIVCAECGWQVPYRHRSYGVVSCVNSDCPNYEKKVQLTLLTGLPVKE